MAHCAVLSSENVAIAVIQSGREHGSNVAQQRRQTVARKGRRASSSRNCRHSFFYENMIKKFRHDCLEKLRPFV